MRAMQERPDRKSQVVVGGSGLLDRFSEVVLLSMFARDSASNARLNGAGSNYGTGEAPGW